MTDTDTVEQQNGDVVEAGEPATTEESEESCESRVDAVTRVRRLTHTLTPPEIWSQDRPSLAKQWTYTRRGQWGARRGFWRRAAVVYFAVVSLPTSFLAYAIEWVGERPSRLIAAGVLFYLGLNTPVVGAVLPWLVALPLWPLALALWLLP